MNIIEKVTSAVTRAVDAVSSYRLSCDLSCKTRAVRKDGEGSPVDGNFEKKFSFSAAWLLIAVIAVGSFILGLFSND